MDYMRANFIFPVSQRKKNSKNGKYKLTRVFLVIFLSKKSLGAVITLPILLARVNPDLLLNSLCLLELNFKIII